MVIDPADTAFSRWIRNRDNWTCIRCFKQYEVGSKGLTNSHYWNRVHEGTRFEPDNCDSLCWFPCHNIWEKEDRDLYKAFKIKQLGQTRFDTLMLQAHSYCKKDRKMQLIIWNEALRQLGI